MARIQLRDATIYIEDGLSGTALINDVAGGAQDATTLTIDAVSLNTDDTDLVPVGARFTISTETGTPVHTVTARTPTSDSPTTDITFTPALAAAVNDDDEITFLPQRIEIKIGDGDFSWTEVKERIYDLDRDQLDDVRDGPDTPLEIETQFIFNYVKTESGKTITPTDALKRQGEASEWVSSDSDQCRPYAVNLRVLHCTPCGTDQDEDLLFEDFRYENLEFSIQDAAVALSGRCNKTEVTATRSDHAECA